MKCVGPGVVGVPPPIIYPEMSNYPRDFSLENGFKFLRHTNTGDPCEPGAAASTPTAVNDCQFEANFETK